MADYAVTGYQFIGGGGINADVHIGNGTLAVGGTVDISGYVRIGEGNTAASPPEVGYLNVDSATLTIGGVVYVGYDVQGVFNLVAGNAGSTVTVAGGTGEVKIGWASTSSGTLNVGAPSGSTAKDAGVLNAASLVFGSGGATLQFNHTATNYVFGIPMSSAETDVTPGAGVDSIVHTAGVTHLTGDSSGYTGGVVVDGGVLSVDGTLGATDFDVNGGTLSGTGTISGPVSVGDAGTLSGTQGSTLAMDSLVLSENAAIQASLGAPDTADPALFDIAGDFTLDGKLSVTNLGTFDYGSYSLFSYGGTLTNNGLTITSLPAGFNPGDWTIADAANVVSLVVASGGGRQYWDGGNTIANALRDGGAGTWNATDTNWTNSAGNINAAWASERAVFGGAAGGTVSVVGAITFTGLVFDTAGYLLSSGTGAGLVMGGSTDQTVTVNASDARVDVPISGTPGLVKLGSGALTLGAANSYTGLTTVQLGSLLLAGSGSIASSSGVDVKSDAVFDISGIAAADSTIQSLEGAGTVAVGSKTLVFGTAASTAFTGTFNGTGTLVKQGSGTFSISAPLATASISRIDIDAGTLATSGGNAIGNATAVDVASGATLAVTGNETAGALSGAGAVTLTSGALTTAGSTATDFSGSITGTGTLVKSGTGTLTLKGTNAYAVGATTAVTGTTVAAGTLAVDGGSLTHANTNLVVGSTTTTSALTIANGTVSNANGYIGNASGNTSTVKVGAGGSWTNAALLHVGASGSGVGSLVVEAGGDVSNVTAVIGQSSGTSSAIVTGVGSTWTTSGRLTVGSSGRGSLTIADGGAVITDNGGNFQDMRVGANSSVNFGAAVGQTPVAPGTLTTTAVQLNAATSSLNFNHTGVLELAANVYVGVAQTTGGINAYSGTTLLSGELSTGFFFSGGPKINVYGGTLELSGDNGSFFDPTINLQAGTLKVSSANALGAGMNAPVTVTATGGTLEISAGVATGAGVALNASAALRVTSGTGTIDGAVTGTGTLQKTGAGTLVLGSGSNTYSGGNVVSAGTLKGSSAALKGNVSLSASAGETATVEFSQAGAGSFAGTISGSGTVVRSGTGDLTLTGTSTYTGTTEIGTGTLVLGNASAAGASTIAFSTAGASTLRLDSSSISNTLSGFGTDDTLDLGDISHADGPVSLTYADSLLDVYQSWGMGGVGFSLHLAPVPDDHGFVASADGDGSTLVRMVVQNDAPVADLDGTASGGAGISYTEQSPALAIAPDAVLSDEDSADFNGGTLSVQLTSNGSDGDVLAILNTGTSAGEIGVAAGIVSYGGMAIGSVSGGTSGAPLVVSFNSAAASVEAVQALVRAVAFSNASDAPSTLSRSVQFTLVDGDGTAGGGADTSVTSATIAVSAQNDAPTGTVTVGGTPTQGQVLTGDASGVGDPDGLGTPSYQWLRGTTPIDGADELSYTLVEEDVGEQIALRVSYTDAAGTPESVTSSLTSAVANLNDPTTGAVTIDGVAKQGEVLSAVTTTLDDADGLGTLSYQWLRGSDTIPGADDASYTLVDADVGAAISVRVRYTDGHGTDEEITSGTTGAVENLNDAPGGAVTLAGTTQQGQTLTADASTVSDVDGLGSFTITWLRDGDTIEGAEGSSYMLVQADVGARIQARVDYTDLRGTPEFVLSAESAAIANLNDPVVGVPTITGTPKQGETLTAVTSGISDADGLGTLGYTWLRDGAVIPGATASSYVLAQSDVGKPISVQVSYTDMLLTPEQTTSAETSLVENTNDDPTGGVSFTGTLRAGSLLTALTAALDDADGLGTLSYEWTRGGTPIPDANASTYLLTDADVDASIGLVVRYTDLQGTQEMVESAVLGPVGDRSVSLVGDRGNNLLEGGNGDDVLDGARGMDTLVGHEGDDTYFVDNRRDQIVEKPDEGNDTVIAGRSWSLEPNVENLVLSDGRSGVGNALDNAITGNAGQNWIEGGLGADTLTGGEGRDRFRYDAAADSDVANGVDRITDFEPWAGDKLRLRGIDADVEARGNQRFTFIGDDTFSSTDASRQLRFDPETHMLYGSTDADADAEFAIELVGVDVLHASSLSL